MVAKPVKTLECHYSMTQFFKKIILGEALQLPREYCQPFLTDVSLIYLLNYHCPVFFAFLLKHAFKLSTDGVYLHSRSDGRCFRSFRSHNQPKKTQVMGQATPSPPCITVNGEELGVVHQCQYLGSTTTDTLSLDVELSKRIDKTSTTLSKLTKRVWENKHLTILTKITVYKAYVISTLLYGSESWTTYSTQERKLQVFHLRCFRRILGITWQDKVRNNDVLSRAGIPSMYTLLRRSKNYPFLTVDGYFFDYLTVGG